MVSRKVESMVFTGLMIMAGAGVNVAGVANAAAFEVTPSDSPVEFLATGKPGFLKIKGQGAQLKGKAKVDSGVLTGDFAVDLTPLKTGIDLRDEHMKERYLETGKFPDAKLVLDPVKVDEAKGGSDIPFTGKLTIKGKESPVKGTLNVAFAGEGSGRSATGDAKFALKIADYPVGVPSHLGVTVADSVDVSLRFRAAQLK